MGNNTERLVSKRKGECDFWSFVCYFCEHHPSSSWFQIQLLSACTEPDLLNSEGASRTHSSAPNPQNPSSEFLCLVLIGTTASLCSLTSRVVATFCNYILFFGCYGHFLYLHQIHSLPHAADFHKLSSVEYLKNLSCSLHVNQNVVINFKGFSSERPRFKHYTYC